MAGQERGRGLTGELGIQVETVSWWMIASHAWSFLVEKRLGLRREEQISGY